MNNEEEKNIEICNDNNINDLKSFKNIKKNIDKIEEKNWKWRNKKKR